MEEESQEIKDIIVYKPIVSPEGLKTLCDKAYKSFDTPLQRINSVLQNLKSIDRSLKSLEITQEDWIDLKDNQSFKKIARKYNNKVIRKQEEQISKRKKNKRK